MNYRLMTVARIRCFYMVLLSITVAACSDSSSQNSMLPSITPPVSAASPLPANVAMLEPGGGTMNVIVEGRSVSISVPEGAVSEALEITLDPVSTSELDALFPDRTEDPLLAFKMLPAGTQFSQPIELSMLAPSEGIAEGDLVVGALASAGVVEPLNISQSDDNGEQRLTIFVPHFSTAILSNINVGFNAIFLDGSGMQAREFSIGDVVVAKVRAFQRTDAPGGALSIDSPGTLNVAGSIVAEGGPETVNVGTANATFPSRNTTGASRVADLTTFEFTCQREGPFSIFGRLSGDLATGKEFGFTAFSSDSELVGNLGILPVSDTIEFGGNCVATVDPADPTDPDTPTDPTDPADPVPSNTQPDEIQMGILSQTQADFDNVIPQQQSPVTISLSSPSVADNRSYKIVNDAFTGNISATFQTEPFSFIQTPILGGFSPESGLGTVSCNGGPGEFSLTWNLEVTDTNAAPVTFMQVVSFSGKCEFDPLAVDDATETIVGTSVDIDFLANDKNVNSIGIDDMAQPTFFVTVDPSGIPNEVGLVPGLGAVTIEQVAANQTTKFVLRYRPTEFKTGVDKFNYFLVTDSTTSVGTVSVTIKPQEVTALDDCGLFGSLNECLNFGAGPFCSPPVATVSCGRLPGDIRGFVQPVIDDNVDSSVSSKFEVPQGANPLTPPSQNGSVRLSSSLGAVDVTINNDGTFVVDAVLDDPGFTPMGDSVTVTSATESLSFPVELEVESGEPALEVEVANGLMSEMLVSTLYSDLTTFVFTHLPTDTDAEGKPIIKGFVDNQKISQGVTIEGDSRVRMPMISAGLLEFMQQNDLQPTQDVVVTARNQAIINGIFEDEEMVDQPVNGGGGIVVRLPPTTITPPAAVCPTRPSNVRCIAGPTEVLLSPNNSSDIARYSANTGEFDGFFFGGGPAPNFGIGRGHMATQGPDNCVLYSDSEGEVHIFDSDGSRIPADGEGNIIQTGADSLLANSFANATEYTGFDFYSPDGIIWKLYLTARVDTTGNGFGDTAQLVRYDYALNGDVVLTNRTVVTEKAGGEFNHVTVRDDLIYLADDSFDSSTEAQDQIRVFDVDGNEQTALLVDSASPRQISNTFDGNLVFADFARESIRVVNSAGATIKNYLLGNNDGTGNDRTRGVYPLRNGNYLVTGFSQINRSVLDRFDGTLLPAPDGRSTIGVAIGTACLASD